MPTARELLEQADALMRRNRALPPSTPRPATEPSIEARSPALPSLPASRPIQREPIASSVVHTALPIEDHDAGEFAEPLSPPPRPADAARERSEDLGVRTSVEADPADDADFPVLTDAVAEPAPRSNGVDEDDLPLLTDAVTPIGTVGVDEAARGEPSLWELTSRGEASVLGPAPDSVMLVPPADAPPVVPQAPPQGRDPLGFDQPAAGFVAPPLSQQGSTPQGDWDVAHDVPEPGTRVPDLAPGSEGVAHERSSGEVESAYPEDDDEPRVFSAAVSHAPPEDAEEAAVGAGDPPAGEDDDGRTQEKWVGSDDEPVQASPEQAPRLQESLEPGLTETVSASSSAPLDGTTAASGYDQQRIREIAEEIGMQVLQRIDIFTDTTLRAQLGERLRPVVDRAAADLVTAINEHVGELLRAQVAEAIEREIESWKSR
jgi:hypothetical protein